MELDLKDYLKMIRKRLWLILIVVAASTLATGIVSFFFLQPVYEASTKLIVNKSNSQGGIDQLSLNDINFNLRLIDTYKEVIKTSAIMEKVIQEHPEFQLTAEELIKKIRISSVNNSQVMTLAVQDISYEKAVSMVNAVSQVFQREIPSIMKVDNVSILDEAKAKAGVAPVKPNPKLNVAISFVVSLMLALGVVFLLEYLDDTIKTEQDVEEILGLPTLSVITKLKDEDLAGVQVAEKKQAGGTSSVTINQ